jgi:hypothetical protein
MRCRAWAQPLLRHFPFAGRRWRAACLVMGHHLPRHCPPWCCCCCCCCCCCRLSTASMVSSTAAMVWEMEMTPGISCCCRERMPGLFPLGYSPPRPPLLPPLLQSSCWEAGRRCRRRMVRWMATQTLEELAPASLLARLALKMGAPCCRCIIPRPRPSAWCSTRHLPRHCTGSRQMFRLEVMRVDCASVSVVWTGSSSSHPSPTSDRIEPRKLSSPPSAPLPPRLLPYPFFLGEAPSFGGFVPAPSASRNPVNHFATPVSLPHHLYKNLPESVMQQHMSPRGGSVGFSRIQRHMIIESHDILTGAVIGIHHVFSARALRGKGERQRALLRAKG